MYILIQISNWRRFADDPGIACATMWQVLGVRALSSQAADLVASTEF